MYKVRGTRYEVRGMRYKVQGAWYKVQGTRYKVRGTMYEARDGGKPLFYSDMLQLSDNWNMVVTGHLVTCNL